MGRRPDVQTAPASIAAFAVLGLGQQIANSLVSVPFRRPWEGPARLVDNVGRSVTRQVMRSFMGYATSLPVPEFRSVEVVIDDLAGAALPPFVSALGVTMVRDEVGGVPGMWYRVHDREPTGTILYLHGGGYIGTSPMMYAAFTGYLARETGCEVFVADYRLAPEFPFPAGLDDAVAALHALLGAGVDPRRLFLAGDSGGGGLCTSLLLDAEAHHLPATAGAILFSPEVDLILDQPSVVENAPTDILPWNIPVGPYLHGVDPHDRVVSAVYADLRGFPATFVAFGDAEMFRDAIRTFVARLRAAEVPTTAVEEPAMFHVYPMLMPWAAASRRAYRAVGTFVEERLAEVGGAPAAPGSP